MVCDEAVRGGMGKKQAVLRLVKDCTDSQPDVTTGTLLGFENGTVTEITNSYPIPLFVQLSQKQTPASSNKQTNYETCRGEDVEREGTADTFSDTVLRCYREGLFSALQGTLMQKKKEEEEGRVHAHERPNSKH